MNKFQIFIIAIVILVFLTVISLLYFGVFKFQPESTRQGQNLPIINPTENLRSANPFDNIKKLNPFKDVYKNPFE